MRLRKSFNFSLRRLVTCDDPIARLSTRLFHALVNYETEKNETFVSAEINILEVTFASLYAHRGNNKQRRQEARQKRKKKLSEVVEKFR